MIKKISRTVLFFFSLLPFSVSSNFADLDFRDHYDITTITCADQLTKDEEFMMIIWLDGYLSALQGQTKSSKDEMGKLEKFLISECQKSGIKTISAIVDRYYLFSGWALP